MTVAKFNAHITNCPSNSYTHSTTQSRRSILFARLRITMSNVHQSLHLLLPTLSTSSSSSSSALPPQLLSLSTSLLAQSRNKAPHLKPEEEIARPYACCEIACKRLGSKLKLPALLHGRPPCAPRVYKKLLTFLDGALAANEVGKGIQEGGSATRHVGEGSGRRSTPRKPREAATRSVQVTPSRSTTTTTPQKRGVAFAGKIAPARASVHEINDDGAPAWVMPLIRRLCQTFSTPLLAPHVYTGLCIIIGLAELEPGQEEGEQHRYRHNVTGLTLALYFMVLARMRRGKVSSEGYAMDCERACTVANEEDISTSVTKENVDDWIKQIASKNWTTDQDWWGSVPENVFDRFGKAATEELEDHCHAALVSRKKRRRLNSGDNEQDPDGVLLPGLGTMMQESVDWLSDDRRAEYSDWLAGFKNRLDRTDKGPGRKPTRANRISAR